MSLLTGSSPIGISSGLLYTKPPQSKKPKTKKLSITPHHQHVADAPIAPLSEAPSGWITTLDQTQLSRLYALEQQNAGFVVGNLVRVIYRPGPFKRGWCNSWSPSMTASIGTGVWQVTAIHGTIGIRIDAPGGCNYPWYVLSQLSQQEIEELAAMIDAETPIGGVEVFADDADE